MKRNNVEYSGLRISIYSALFFGTLGIGFSIWSQSQAVLLDGAYNLLSFFLALVGLRISQSLSKPESEQYPIGLYALESLFVLGKGLIILLLTTVVLINSLITLLNGGNELRFGPILIYLSVALIGNLIVYFTIKRKNKVVNSPILDVETSNWKINSLITASIAFSIVLAFLLQGSFVKNYLRYLDQIIVMAVSLLTLSIPLNAIKEGLSDLLLFSPKGELRDQLAENIQQITEKEESIRYVQHSLLKTGRKLWIAIYIRPAKPLIEAGLPNRIKKAVEQKFKDSAFLYNVDVILSSA